MTDDDGYLPVQQCAERMGITVEQLMALIQDKVVKARRWGGWALEAEPAIIPGLTARPKRAGGGPRRAAKAAPPPRKGRSRK
jgi:hypothetical protein